MLCPYAERHIDGYFQFPAYSIEKDFGRVEGNR